ncbi:MAG: exonuclease SbcCD subunit D [Oscillospiraceae bacterium]|nr:exonuclease SbcCD subunit D [Oscillospiraceae bacterium]
MKLIHLSDLHLGKRVNEFSMLDDQRYILEQILGVIDAEQPDAVAICGDVYDKSVPSAEAVQAFDAFLCALAERERKVFVISGNHDSPERLAFASRLIEASGVSISPVYDGTVSPVTLHDSHGPVSVYMLPFVKPAHVRRFFPETQIESYTDALRVAVEQMAIDPARRNILLTHQFVTGAARSESEEISVGGADNVDGAVFDGFDYVALGHSHRAQSGCERIRDCGAPLKYAVSEAEQEKSLTVAELGEKGTLTVRTVPLIPMRDLRALRGSYRELMEQDGKGIGQDYVHITLTDEEDIPLAAQRLRVIYPNLLKLDYDNARTRAGMQIVGTEDLERKSPMELFAEFYEKQNGRPLSEEQLAFSLALMEEIWEGSL